MQTLNSIDYRKARAEQGYDPLVIQVERITKALKHLSAQGVDIGPDGLEQVQHCDDVRETFKK